MTVKEAYSEFKKSHSDLIILSCYEYESCFVFHAIAGENDGDSIENMELDSLYSVRKSDGALLPFSPFDISEEEYNGGKEVKLNFESNGDKSYATRIESAKSWLSNRGIKND